ncbi:MAG: hypothetical protein FWE08_07470 [Oscillospiraceae bacterium]|nr:hypothetical protein [Oscillospiraceae bacterium]
MSKHGVVIIRLATDFLRKEAGGRVETIEALSQKYDVGRGTVQTALNYLIDMDAIRLEKRGHLGTTVSQISYNRLFQIAGVDHVVGVMPLPSSKVFEGLATGLFKTLNQSAVQFNFSFMTGSKNRLRSILNRRNDFAVMSKASAVEFLRETSDIKIAYELRSSTFITDHALYARVDYDGYFPGMKVGIDEGSLDQRDVSEAYFADKDVVFVPVKYAGISQSLRNKTIDAALWSQDNLFGFGEGLKMISLNFQYTPDEKSYPVIVSLKDRDVINAFLLKYVDDNMVSNYQRVIMNDEAIPMY